jgi:hypothetical protein
MLRSFFISVLILVSFQLNAQLLSIKLVEGFPLISTDEINKQLTEEGWSKSSMQFVTDSNFIRRTWEVNIKSSNIKSYLLHYEFPNEPGEGYVIYQFPDRANYKKMKKEILDLGYKQLNGGKPKKKNKGKQENIHKEKEELYYNEKTKRLTVIKEVFFYGLFSFLVYTYKPNSSVAEHVMHPTPEDESPKN